MASLSVKKQERMSRNYSVSPAKKAMKGSKSSGGMFETLMNSRNRASPYVSRIEEKDIRMA